MAQVKEYSLVWLADDGTQFRLGTIISNNPKEVLFNEICRMMIVASNYFQMAENINIRKLIKTGNSRREHYFAEINNNVLSIMEAHYVHRPN